MFPLSPVFRVRIYLCVCVYTSLDLKDVRMLSATTGPVKLLKDESHGATTASSFPSFLLLSLKYSRRGFGETFSKKFASKNCPFLSLEFSSRSITFKKKKKIIELSFCSTRQQDYFTIEEERKGEESNLINLIIDSEERITFDQNWNRNIRPRI